MTGSVPSGSPAQSLGAEGPEQLLTPGLPAGRSPVPAVPDEAIDGRVRGPYPLTVAGQRAGGINKVSKTIKPNGPVIQHPPQPASKPTADPKD